MEGLLEKKPIKLQCLNIDCPRCGATASFDCINDFYGAIDHPHRERVRAMQALVSDSHNDWVLRKILRERNFAR